MSREKITDSSGLSVNSDGSKHRPTFAIACWMMALIAFMQLMSVGTALALSWGKPRTIIKKVSEPTDQRIVSVSARPAQEDDSNVSTRDLEEILAKYKGSESGAITAIAPPSTNTEKHRVNSRFERIAIANPQVEKLIRESREYHLKEDIVKAMLKLAEAARIDPNESAVGYHKGLLHEEMGNYVEAADEYQKIQQLGVDAGAYYKLAANKLQQGMHLKEVQMQTLAIGPVKKRHFKEGLVGDGAEVTISLLARPDQTVSPDLVELQVHFYDKLSTGEIVKAAHNAQREFRWADEQLD